MNTPQQATPEQMQQEIDTLSLRLFRAQEAANGLSQLVQQVAKLTGFENGSPQELVVHISNMMVIKPDHPAHPAASTATFGDAPENKPATGKARKRRTPAKKVSPVS
jgi:hypothetical protein